MRGHEMDLKQAGYEVWNGFIQCQGAGAGSCEHGDQPSSPNRFLCHGRLWESGETYGPFSEKCIINYQLRVLGDKGTLHNKMNSGDPFLGYNNVSQ